jgi:hypothetical protein
MAALQPTLLVSEIPRTMKTLESLASAFGIS